MYFSFMKVSKSKKISYQKKTFKKNEIPFKLYFWDTILISNSLGQFLPVTNNRFSAAS
jgi:hypothetical protein